MGRIGSQYVISMEMVDTGTFEVLTKAYGVYDNLEALLKDIENLAQRLVPTEIKTIEPEIEQEKREIAPVMDDQSIIIDSYFCLGAGFGLTFPLGELSEILAMGLTPLVFFRYNLETKIGYFQIGIGSGLNYENTKEDVTEGYHLFIVPAAIDINYGLNIANFFHVSLGSLIGITLNGVQYKGDYPGKEDLIVTKFFLEPGLAMGFKFFNLIGINTYGRIPFIFFDNTIYIGCTAGVSLEFFL